jgi:hypothetical protein
MKYFNRSLFDIFKTFNSFCYSGVGIVLIFFMNNSIDQSIKRYKLYPEISLILCDIIYYRCITKIELQTNFYLTISSIIQIITFYLLTLIS